MHITGQAQGWGTAQLSCWDSLIQDSLLCQCNLGTTSEMRRNCALQSRGRLKAVPEGCAGCWAAAGTRGNTKEWRSKGCKVWLSTGKLMQQEGKQLCFCHTWTLGWIPSVCPDTQTHCSCTYLEPHTKSHQNQCVWTQVRYLPKVKLFLKIWKVGWGEGTGWPSPQPFLS